MVRYNNFNRLITITLPYLNMIYISDHPNWQIEQYSICSDRNPVTSVYTNVKKQHGSQWSGYPEQNIDPYYNDFRNIFQLEQEGDFSHMSYSISYALLTKGLLFPVIILIQYFKILILLVIWTGNRPNSPYIKWLAVLRLTCKTLLQNERCTRSTSRAQWKPHTSEPYDNTGWTSLSIGEQRKLGSGAYNS